MNEKTNKTNLAGAILSGAAGVALLTLSGSTAQAAAITMIAADGWSSSTSLATKTTNWSNAAAASAGNTYTVDSTGFAARLIIRTPRATAAVTFAGDSLTLTGIGNDALGSALQFDGPDGQTITINNLILNAGSIITTGNTTTAANNSGLERGNYILNGSIVINGTGITSATASSINPPFNDSANIGPKSLTINSSLSGTGTLRLAAGGRPGTIILNSANNTAFDGFVYIENTIVTFAADGTVGTSDVQMGASAKLTLQGGATNNYIGDAANLILPNNTTAGLVNLNFTGTDTVAGISFNGGTTFVTTPGTYGAAGADFNSPVFTGTGLLQIVPEPASLGLLGLAGVAGLARRRRA